jgi:hypothetical protein
MAQHARFYSSDEFAPFVTDADNREERHRMFDL